MGVSKLYALHPIVHKLHPSNLFLNSASLSVKTFCDPPNWQYTLVDVYPNYVPALLVFSGMQNTYPVCIQITVRVYLLPLEDGGWNSPIRSIEMNFIGVSEVLKCNLLYFTTCLLYFKHNIHCLTCFVKEGFNPFQ